MLHFTVTTVEDILNKIPLNIHITNQHSFSVTLAPFLILLKITLTKEAFVS